MLGHGNGNTPVALAGRVMAKFDATNGDVASGDILTTSANGKLMKATKAGPTVGKALSVSENGYVLTLLNIGWYDPSEVTLAQLTAVSERISIMEALSGAATEGSSTVASSSTSSSLKVAVLEEFGQIKVTDAATFEGTLTVKKLATFEGNIVVLGDLKLAGNLEIGGAVLAEFKAGEKLSRGETVYLSAANTIKKATAKDEGKLPAIGLAISDVEKDAVVKVAIGGIVGGFEKLEVGKRYFVGTEEGRLTKDAPEKIGEAVQVVGLAKSETELLIMVGLTYSVNKAAPALTRSLKKSAGYPTATPTLEVTATPTPILGRRDLNSDADANPEVTATPTDSNSNTHPDASKLRRCSESI